MNNTSLSFLQKLSQFIQSIGEEKSLVDIQKLQNIIDLKIQQTSISLNDIIHFYEYCESQEFLKMHSSRIWTDEEWKVLIWVIQQYCLIYQKNSEDFKGQDWENISNIIAFKDKLNCQFKWYSHLRIMPTNKNWSSEEEQLLYNIITKEQNIKWFEVQYEMFIQSSGLYFRKAKQYRERWNNYLNPQVNKGIWTELDDYNLLQHVLVEGQNGLIFQRNQRIEQRIRLKIALKVQQIRKEKLHKYFRKSFKKYLKMLLNKDQINNHGFLFKQFSKDQNQLNKLIQIKQTHQQLNQYLLLQNPQQYYLNQFLQVPRISQQQPISNIQLIQQLSTFQHIPSQINIQQQLLNCQSQSYPQSQQGISTQIPQHQKIVSQQIMQQKFIQHQQQYQSTIHDFYQDQQFLLQQQQQQSQQYKCNLFSYQQNTSTNSIGTLSSQKSDKLVSDQIKEEENSGSSSNKEPKVQKMVCISVSPSINGSTSSVNSIDAIKKKFKNMSLDSEQNSPDLISKRKHQRSQSGAYDLNNQGKVKTKRSRFYYASYDS